MPIQKLAHVGQPAPVQDTTDLAAKAKFYEVLRVEFLCVDPFDVRMTV